MSWLGFPTRSIRTGGARPAQHPPPMTLLDRYVTAGLATPVVVADEIEWISRDQWLAEREQVRHLLSTWI